MCTVKYSVNIEKQVLLLYSFCKKVPSVYIFIWPDDQIWAGICFPTHWKNTSDPQKKPYLAPCLQLPATKKIWTFKDVQNKCTRGWSKPDKESYQCPSWHHLGLTVHFVVHFCWASGASKKINWRMDFSHPRRVQWGPGCLLLLENTGEVNLAKTLDLWLEGGG